MPTPFTRTAGGPVVIVRGEGRLNPAESRTLRGLGGQTRRALARERVRRPIKTVLPVSVGH